MYRLRTADFSEARPAMLDLVSKFKAWTTLEKQSAGSKIKVPLDKSLSLREPLHDMLRSDSR